MKVEEELAPSSAPDEQSTNGSPPSIDLPESRGYRLKKGLLGPPLHTERLAHERLGKPTALAVFASDNLSSAVSHATKDETAKPVPPVPPVEHQDSNIDVKLFAHTTQTQSALPSGGIEIAGGFGVAAAATDPSRPSPATW